jgi:hypothetical protein
VNNVYERGVGGAVSLKEGGDGFTY